MRTSELMRLYYWVEEELIERNIPDLYQQLYDLIQNNINNPSSGTEFTPKRNELLRTLRKASIEKLSLEQINLLNQLDISDVIAEEGAQNLEDLFQNSKHDLAHILSHVHESKQALNDAIEYLTNVNTQLEKYFDSTEDATLNTGEVLIKVYFQNESSINDINDFKKMGATWHGIGRGIAMAQNGSPEDIRVVGAQSGSIIIELAVVAKIAIAFSSVLLFGLKVTERILELQKKKEEIKGLKLKNKQVLIELKKEEEQERKEGIKNVTDHLISELKLKDLDGDVRTALEKAVKEMLGFTEKGGNIDIVKPETTDDEVENSKVRNIMKQIDNNVKEIRKLENRIKLIEIKNQTD